MYVVYFIEFYIKAKFLDNTSVYIVKLPFIFKIPGQRLSKNHNIQTDSKNVTIIKNSDSNNEIIIQIFTIFTKKLGTDNTIGNDKANQATKKMANSYIIINEYKLHLDDLIKKLKNKLNSQWEDKWKQKSF